MVPKYGIEEHGHMMDVAEHRYDKTLIILLYSGHIVSLEKAINKSNSLTEKGPIYLFICACV